MKLKQKNVQQQLTAPHSTKSTFKHANTPIVQKVAVYHPVIAATPVKNKRTISRFSALEDFLAIKNHEELVSFFEPVQLEKVFIPTLME